MSGRVTVENVRVLKGVLAGVSRCKIPFVNIRRLKFTKVNRKPIRKSDRRNEIDSSEHLVKYVTVDKGVKIFFWRKLSLQFICEYGGKNNWCGKMFERSEDLNQHKRIHYAIQCHLCKKKFHKKECLLLHKKIYHKSKLIECQFCQNFMKDKRSLRRHLNNNWCKALETDDEKRKNNSHYLKQDSLEWKEREFPKRDVEKMI